jgi:hypothetical protein
VGRAFAPIALLGVDASSTVRLSPPIINVVDDIAFVSDGARLVIVESYPGKLLVWEPSTNRLEPLQLAPEGRIAGVS